MKHCPNPDCLFLAEVGCIAEYEDNINICFDCDTSLVPGEAPPLPIPYRPLFWQPTDLVQTITTYVDREEALADQEELDSVGITAAVKPELITEDDGSLIEIYHLQVQPADKARSLEILDIDETEISPVDDEYWQQLEVEGCFTAGYSEKWMADSAANSRSTEEQKGHIIEYRNSKLKYFGYLCLALLFVALGVAAVADGVNVGWWMIALLGPGIFIFGKQILDDKARIIIDNQGITDVTLRVGKILWADIEAAEKQVVRNQPFISLTLKNEEEYLARLLPFQRRLTALNLLFGATRLNLNLSGVKGSADEILKTIRERIPNDSKVAQHH